MEKLNARHITMYNCISGTYNDKDKGWQTLPEEYREYYFKRMVEWLMANGSKRSKLYDELAETKIAYVNNCGILERFWVDLDNDEQVEYCAGQDYPSELLYVKKIVAGRRVR